MIKLKDLYPNQVSFNKKKYFGEEETVNEAVKDPKLKVGQKIRFKKSGEVFILRQIIHGKSRITEDPAGTTYVFVKREEGGNRKEYFTKKTWANALKKKSIQLESVKEAAPKMREKPGQKELKAIKNKLESLKNIDISTRHYSKLVSALKSAQSAISKVEKVIQMSSKI